MGDIILQTEQLTKRFSKRILAVDGLDLQIPRGQVFGFPRLGEVIIGLVREMIISSASE